MLAKRAHKAKGEIETAELELRAMGPLGDTVAEFEGEPINVFGGITGERVVARIYRYRRRKKNIVSAIVDAVLEPSIDRVETPCPYYGPCSGCQWQHISYKRQLQLKREAVEAQFSRLPSAGFRRGLSHARRPIPLQLQEPRSVHREVWRAARVFEPHYAQVRTHRRVYAHG